MRFALLLVLALAAPPPAAAPPRAGYDWPLSGRPAVVRPFTPPPEPWLPGHRGVDLAGAAGAQVLAAGAGLVHYAGAVAGVGTVSVLHPDGLLTTYQPVTALVATGRAVRAGEPLGVLQAGHPGCPAAACLHWGLRRGLLYLDPLALLGRGRVRLLPLEGKATLERPDPQLKETFVERTHAAPRTAVVWAVLRAELARRAGEKLTVVDVGGGTGGFAVPLAEAGHRVTVVDSNPDALAALTRRAAEAGVADRIHALQADADGLADLVPAAEADLVLCHSVLEFVDDPRAVVGAVAGALRPGGAASFLVANRAAAALARAISGQLPAAMATFTDPEGRSGSRDTLLRRYDASSATELLAGAGLTVAELHGVRVVADLVPGAMLESEPGAYEALLRFELATAATSPYRDIATQLHLLARKP